VKSAPLAYRIIGSNVGCHFLLRLLWQQEPWKQAILSRLSTSPPYPSHSGDAGKTLVSDLNGAQLCGISWGELVRLGSQDLGVERRPARPGRPVDTPLKEVLRPLLQEVGIWRGKA